MLAPEEDGGGGSVSEEGESEEGERERREVTDSRPVEARLG